MKLLPLFLVPTLSLSAATITQWNFNSVPGDAAVATGTTAPSTGVGAASLLTTTAVFATGAGTVINPTNKSSDTNTTDNSAWGVATFPAATAGDLTAGAQFLVDTTGYESINFTFDLRHSNTSSRYEAVQYTLNGSTWSTLTFFTDAVGDTWSNGRTVSFAAIPQTSNNANFGVRVVAAHASTAGIVGGAANYVATGPASTYATTGNWRFDMATVSGTLIPEPSSALLGTIGLLGLLRRRR